MLQVLTIHQRVLTLENQPTAEVLMLVTTFAISITGQQMGQTTVIPAGYTTGSRPVSGPATTVATSAMIIMTCITIITAMIFMIITRKTTTTSIKMPVQ